MKPRLTTLIAIVWSIVLQAVANMGVAGYFNYTTPAGIRSVFGYDSAGRLTSSGIDGLGTLLSWEYAISQTGENYVKETTWQKASSADGAPYKRANFDGLGRQVSEVSAWKGTDWKYVASATEYDAMGRPYRAWSAAPADSDNPSASDVSASATAFHGDSKPYALTTYEASQRRLPLSTLKAGEAWHKGSHKATVRRLVNDASAYACARYDIGTDGKLMHTGNYAKGALSVEETTDEDGITVATFTDMRGARWPCGCPCAMPRRP